MKSFHLFPNFKANFAIYSLSKIVTLSPFKLSSPIKGYKSPKPNFIGKK